MKALHFGAGNIGRGFIGFLLARSGYGLTFVDVAPGLVADINRLGRYRVVTLGASRNVEEVEGVRAIDLNDEAALDGAVRDADLITLSIGANHLAGTGKVLRSALQERRRSNGSRPLDVIACENALYATDRLRDSILEGAEPEFSAWMGQTVGFPNCAVDRIVPNAAVERESPIDVAVEDYCEWDIERGKVRANFSIAGAEYVDNLAPYLERKLFLLNGAHALIAYAGYRKGYRMIHEAVRDPEIRSEVLEFHREAIAALSRKHGMAEEVLRRYSERLVARFENAYLRDEVVRVGRDPLRKLSDGDRLMTPLRLCSRYGIGCEGIVFALAAGFAFDDAGDPGAAKIQRSIAETGIEHTVRAVTGLEEDSPLADRIAQRYLELVRAK